MNVSLLFLAGGSIISTCLAQWTTVHAINSDDLNLTTGTIMAKEKKQRLPVLGFSHAHCGNHLLKHVCIYTLIYICTYVYTHRHMHT